MQILIKNVSLRAFSWLSADQILVVCGEHGIRLINFYCWLSFGPERTVNAVCMQGLIYEAWCNRRSDFSDFNGTLSVREDRNTALSRKMFMHPNGREIHCSTRKLLSTRRTLENTFICDLQTSELLLPKPLICGWRSTNTWKLSHRWYDPSVSVKVQCFIRCATLTCIIPPGNPASRLLDKSNSNLPCGANPDVAALPAPNGQTNSGWRALRACYRGSFNGKIHWCFESAFPGLIVASSVLVFVSDNSG